MSRLIRREVERPDGCAEDGPMRVSETADRTAAQAESRQRDRRYLSDLVVDVAKVYSARDGALTCPSGEPDLYVALQSLVDAARPDEAPALRTQLEGAEVLAESLRARVRELESAQTELQEELARAGAELRQAWKDAGAREGELDRLLVEANARVRELEGAANCVLDRWAEVASSPLVNAVRALSVAVGRRGFVRDRAPKESVAAAYETAITRLKTRLSDLEESNRALRALVDDAIDGAVGRTRSAVMGGDDYASAQSMSVETALRELKAKIDEVTS